MRAALLLVPLAISGCYCSHEAVRDAATTDASHDAGTDAPLPDAPPSDGGPIDAGPPLCAASAPNADLTGTTPLGPISFAYGWAGERNRSKACFEIAIAASASPELHRSGDGDRLFAWIRLHDEPIVGTHEDVFTTLIVGGTEVTASATVEVLSYDPTDRDAPVRARIAIVADGWDVQGTIGGPYCDTFRDPCL